MLSGCRMNNLHKAIVVFRDGSISHVEKACQLAFLKLKLHRKGVVVGVTAALFRMAIGRCWVCGIGSSTALLLSDAMLLLAKEISGLYPRFQ